MLPPKVAVGGDGVELEWASTSLSESFIVTDAEFMGVKETDMMSGLGRHFATWPIASRPASTWMLARKVDNLDFFLSHSWQMTRWSKWLTLCFAMNLRSALLAGNCAALSALPLSAAFPMGTRRRQSTGEEIPLSIMCCVCGLSMCVSVLLFGQRLREQLGMRPSMFFFDRLCINQRHAVKKQKGIRMLGAFVARSQEMMIIMDATYWQSLWCAFEVAAFVRAKKVTKTEGMRFLVPGRNAITVSMFIVNCVALAFKMLYLFLGWTSTTSVLHLVALRMCSCCDSILVAPFVLRYLATNRDRAATLSAFALNEAHCSVEDDRLVIAYKIRHWFGSIARFEAYVKRDLHQVASRGCHPFRIPLSSLMLADLPDLCFELEHFAHAWGGIFPRCFPRFIYGDLCFKAMLTSVLLCLADPLMQVYSDSGRLRRRLLEFSLAIAGGGLELGVIEAVRIFEIFTWARQAVVAAIFLLVWLALPALALAAQRRDRARAPAPAKAAAGVELSAGLRPIPAGSGQSLAHAE